MILYPTPLNCMGLITCLWHKKRILQFSELKCCKMSLKSKNENSWIHELKNSISDVMNMLLAYLLVRTLKCTYGVILYLFCPWKYEKKYPQKENSLAKLHKFSVLPWWPNLPNNSKSTIFIWVFIVLGISLTLYSVQMCNVHAFLLR